MNTLGNVLDSMLAVRLSYWVDEEGILPNAHMGGRKGIGVEHVIQLLLERIAGVFVSRTHWVATLLMLDVSGAFDNVSHEELLNNTRKRGVPEEAVRWIQSFLTDRSTHVKLPELASEKLSTPHGIP